MDIWMIISKIKNLASKALILNHFLLLIIRVVIIKSKFDNSANKTGVRYAKALGFFKILSEINKLKWLILITRKKSRLSSRLNFLNSKKRKSNHQNTILLFAFGV